MERLLLIALILFLAHLSLAFTLSIFEYLDVSLNKNVCYHKWPQFFTYNKKQYSKLNEHKENK